MAKCQWTVFFQTAACARLSFLRKLNESATSMNGLNNRRKALLPMMKVRRGAAPVRQDFPRRPRVKYDNRCIMIMGRPRLGLTGGSVKDRREQMRERGSPADPEILLPLHYLEFTSEIRATLRIDPLRGADSGAIVESCFKGWRESRSCGIDTVEERVRKELRGDFRGRCR